MMSAWQMTCLKQQTTSTQRAEENDHPRSPESLVSFIWGMKYPGGMKYQLVVPLTKRRYTLSRTSNSSLPWSKTQEGVHDASAPGYRILVQGSVSHICSLVCWFWGKVIRLQLETFLCMSKFGNSAQIVEPIAGCSERKWTDTDRQTKAAPKAHRFPANFPLGSSPACERRSSSARLFEYHEPDLYDFLWRHAEKKPPDQVLGLMGNGKTWDIPTYKMGDSPQPHCRRDPEGSGGVHVRNVQDATWNSRMLMFVKGTASSAACMLIETKMLIQYMFDSTSAMQNRHPEPHPLLEYPIWLLLKLKCQISPTCIHERHSIPFNPNSLLVSCPLFVCW